MPQAGSPAGRPSIRSAAGRWRGGAPPMAVGGAVDRHFIFPAAFWIIDAHLSIMGRRSTLRSFRGERDGDPLAGHRDMETRTFRMKRRLAVACVVRAMALCGISGERRVEKEGDRPVISR